MLRRNAGKLSLLAVALGYEGAFVTLHHGPFISTRLWLCHRSLTGYRGAQTGISNSLSLRISPVRHVPVPVVNNTGYRRLQEPLPRKSPWRNTRHTIDSAPFSYINCIDNHMSVQVLYRTCTGTVPFRVQLVSCLSSLRGSGASALRSGWLRVAGLRSSG